MSSANGVVAWELVKAGYGVSMQPEILGDAEPGIEKVLPGIPVARVPDLAGHAPGTADQPPHPDRLRPAGARPVRDRKWGGTGALDSARRAI
jgi:hypothetical protein